MAIPSGVPPPMAAASGSSRTSGASRPSTAAVPASRQIVVARPSTHATPKREKRATPARLRGTSMGATTPHSAAASTAGRDSHQGLSCLRAAGEHWVASFESSRQEQWEWLQYYAHQLNCLCAAPVTTTTTTTSGSSSSSIMNCTVQFCQAARQRRTGPAGWAARLGRQGRSPPARLTQSHSSQSSRHLHSKCIRPQQGEVGRAAGQEASWRQFGSETTATATAGHAHMHTAGGLACRAGMHLAAQAQACMLWGSEWVQH